MAPVSTIELDINEQVHNYAKIYSSLLTDEFQRKRAYASITALYALTNLLEKTDKELQTTMTMFRNPTLNEQYEISDIYVNNWHIDVRVITDGDAFLVPKSHFDNNIVPDFYAVIKVDKALEKADLIGFANTKTMEKRSFDYHYYSVLNSTLLNYAEFLSAVSNKKVTSFSEEDHNIFRESYLGILDGEIDRLKKNKILKHLFECEECRSEFCCFTGFEMVNKNLAQYPNLIDDQTLNIVGAQAVIEPQYDGKEETIYIGDDEVSSTQDNVENTILEEKAELPELEEKVEDKLEIIADETTGETVSDILDELFSTEEPEFKQDVAEEKPIQTDLDIIDTKDSELEEFVSETDLYAEENKESEMVFLEAVENIDNEIIIHEDNAPEDLTSDIEVLSDSTKESEMVQKVIVDYDEYGEPIYSYITNVANTEENSNEDKSVEENEIEAKVEDSVETESIEDAPTETIDEQENIPEESSKTTNEETPSSVRTVSYYYPENEDEQSSYEEEVQEVEASKEEEYVENNEDELINDEDVEFQEYEEQVAQDDEEINEDSDIEFIEDEEDIEETYDESEFLTQPEEIDSQEYTAAEYEAEEVNDEEMEAEDSTIEENNVSEETADDSDNNEDSDEDDDNFDYDDEDFGQKPANNPKQKTIIGALVILLVLSCGCAFFFMKNINAAHNTTADNLQNQTETIEEASANDLFEQSDEDNYGITDEDYQEQTETNENQASVDGQTQDIPEQTQNQDNQVPTTGTIAVPETNNIEVPQLTEKELLKQQPTGDVNKVLSNAFSSGTPNISVKGVNWQCAPDLFTNKTFKAYLQNLDNVLKLNLKNNILNATEVPQNNSVAIKFAINNDGELLRNIVSVSSGSTQIDNIVLQSIKETLESQKTRILNDGDQKADKYYIQVVIKL